MQSPLLSGEDADATPSLSAGPPLVEESEFSRLIAQRSPLDALAERFEEGNSGAIPSNLLFLDVGPNDLVHGRCSSAISVIPARGPFTTAIAGTLAILHLFFVWAAYTSDIWAESRVRISIAWQEQYLPLLNDAKETVIHSTNLMSLLQDLNASRNYLLMFLLWSVSLLLPCAFMIVSPTFVLADSMSPILYASRSRSWTGRGILECLMRWALFTFYVIMLLSLATSFIELQWTDTTIQAGNRARGPLAAYLVGITCAVALAGLLRSPPASGAIGSTVEEAETSSGIALVRSPPPHAFQHPWMPINQEDQPAMTVLEETSQEPFDRKREEPTPSGLSTPDLVPENDGGEGKSSDLSFWKKFAAFQFGLLSVILWIPVVYLPFVHISYGGVATNFLSESTLRLYVWDISFSLWRQGVEFGTPIWILLTASSILLLTTMVLPLLASCLGVVAWVGEGELSTKCYAWLFACNPALGGTVYAVAVLAMTHALTPLSQSLLNQESAGICQKFSDMTGETCLDVSATPLPGIWFYFAQSIMLELFVLVTLKWC